MCMRNTDDGCILAKQQGELKSKVAELDSRLTKVETELKDSRDENRRGFDDIKKQLGYIYSEKAKWGEWARAHIGQALKWAGYIILAACGINQTNAILQTIQKWSNSQ